jgi:hypothetical protein
LNSAVQSKMIHGSKARSARERKEVHLAREKALAMNLGALAMNFGVSEIYLKSIAHTFTNIALSMGVRVPRT